MLAPTGLRSNLTTPDRSAARRLGLDLAVAYLLLWAAHTVYRANESTVQMCDSAYSMAVAEQWLNRGNIDMTEYVPADPQLRQQMPGYQPGGDMPYQFLRHPANPRPGEAQHIYYGYPLGSTVLSVPFVKKYTDRGFALRHPNGAPHVDLEMELQQKVAARVSAWVVVLFFVIARFWCPPALAALIAAGFAFGSPVWSTLARGLWSHTWMAFWLSAAVAVVVGRTRLPRAGWRTDLGLGLLLGTCLFWVVFVRTQGVLSCFAIGAYLLLHHRRLLAATVLAGGAWSAVLVALSLHTFGTVMPPSVYSPEAIDGRDVLNRFFWLMCSPSRGLLVYCPYLAVVGVMLLAFRRHLTNAGLLLPAALAIMAHTAVFSCYNGWHGGSSYGPRYFVDLFPWFVLLTAMAVRALSDAPPAGVSWRKAAAAGALVVGFGWGVFVHSRAATELEAWYWNYRARVSGEDGAVKEWDHPQFLAGRTFKVNQDGTVTPLP